MNRWLGHGLRLLLVAAGLAYATWGVDFGLLWASLRAYSPLALLAALVAVALLLLAMGLRLKLLATRPVRYSTAALAILVGHGVNNMAPTRIGELVKAVYLARHGGLSRAEAFGVVFWERFLDLNALVLLGLLPIWLAAQLGLMGPMLAVVAAIWLTVFVLRQWPAFPLRALARLPVQRLRLFLLELHEQVQARLDARFLLLGSASTGLVWAGHLLHAGLVFWLVAGLPLDLQQALIVLIVAMLGLALPPTPGGLGVFEAAIVLALGWYDIPREQALATAIVMRMTVYVPVTLLALLVLARQETGFGELLRGR